jgi:hypothetical protein
MKLIWPAGARPYERHPLDPAKIVETAENPALGVGERLPERQLSTTG